MVDLVEAGGDVALEDLVIAADGQEPDLLDGVLATASRTEPVTGWVEVSFQNRLQHQLQRRLHDSVSDRGNPEPTNLAVRLRDLHGPHRHRGEPAVLHLQPQVGQEPSHAVLARLDRGRSSRVDARRPSALVSPDPVPRRNEESRVGHEVEQIIKATVGFGRRPTVQLGLDLQYSVFRQNRVAHQSVDIHQRVF